MVEVTFTKGSHGFEGMKLLGHAEYDPGNDVVCAGISAVSQALVGTLQNLKNIVFRTKIIESGNILIETGIFLDENVQRVVDAMYLTCFIGLLQIEQGYPEYLKVSQL